MIDELKIKTITEIKLQRCEGPVTNNLPRGMRVDGNLIFDYNPDLIKAPDDLLVNGSCSFRACDNLKHVSENLIVKDSLLIQYCQNITELPKGMIVYRLFLSANKNLNKIAEDISVRLLSMRGCVNINKLPKAFAGRSMVFLDIKNSAIDEIPDGMNLELLNIEGCRSIQDLPQSLTVIDEVVYNADTGFASDKKKIKELKQRFRMRFARNRRWR
jgi:hypothetical protein